MDINLKYLPNFNFQTHSLAANMTKKDHGVNHPLTHAFLIPHTHMHLVYQQSEGEAKAKVILSNMKKNKILIDMCCLPAFLYCMKLYNLVKIKSGLFHGPLLLCMSILSYLCGSKLGNGRQGVIKTWQHEDTPYYIYHT
ncbi:hypothetical protein VKT23_014916 [Stygiomarasmius scandens]|uniref:Uncharacterized protein n=1 Tax=Marasmiellus scandens TaxID=2682957 RepID=A0ABR1IZR5_9AGAR